MHAIHRLNTLHKAMILIRNLVRPSAKTTSAKNTSLPEIRQRLGQCAVPLERGRRVPVLEAADVRAYDFVVRKDHVVGDELRDALVENRRVVYGLVGGFGHFEHNGPVGAWLGCG